MQAIALQDMGSQPSAWLNEKLQWDYARYRKKINTEVSQVNKYQLACL